MSSITPQYTESNLVGNLEDSISTTDTTILATFLDRISGEQRTPLAATKLFVIDKGTEQFPNANYEIILAGSHSTAAGITTLINCVRGLSFSSANSLAAGTGMEHIANAEIGCVDVHFLWTILSSILDGTNSPPAFKIGTPITFELTGIFKDRVFADTTARDAAIVSPANGMSCYVTADGVFYDYQAGSWAQRANGATPIVVDHTAGKIDIADATEMQNLTAIDATSGAPNAITIANAAQVSGPSAYTIPMSGATGALDNTWIPTAVFKATATTKGDLLVATASATIARQGVGSNDQVLIADSAQTNGIKWGTVPLSSANFANGKTTRSNTAATGTLVIAHGLASTPKVVRTKAVTLIAATSISSSDGVWKSGTENSVGYTQDINTLSAYTINDTTSIYLELSVGNNQKATIAVDATNITYNFVKTGTGAGAGADIQILWEAET